MPQTEYDAIKTGHYDSVRIEIYDGKVSLAASRTASRMALPMHSGRFLRRRGRARGRKRRPDLSRFTWGTAKRRR